MYWGYLQLEFVVEFELGAIPNEASVLLAYCRPLVGAKFKRLLAPRPLEPRLRKPPALRPVPELR